MEKTDGLLEIIKNNIDRQWDGDGKHTWMVDTEEKKYKALASALRTYISGCLPKEMSVEFPTAAHGWDSHTMCIKDFMDGFNACLKSVREALRLGE